MIKTCIYMLTDQVFATSHQNINPQRSINKKMKKTRWYKHNWHDKQVEHILQHDYYLYTNYIINCNCHKILSMNGYVVLVIISYLLFCYILFTYLIQNRFAQSKVCKYMKNTQKIKSYDLITKTTYVFMLRSLWQLQLTI